MGAGNSRTLGSEMTPGVCTCTILCRSLMQHTRTPIGAVSMRFSILDLMATMFCHVAASSGRDILGQRDIRPVQRQIADSCAAIVHGAGSEAYVDGHGVWSRTTS